MNKLLVFSIVILFSCKPDAFKIHNTFKGLPLPFRFSKFIDTIKANDDAVAMRLPNKTVLIAFKDNYNNIPYYSFVSTSRLERQVITQYTIDFATREDAAYFENIKLQEPRLKPIEELIGFTNPQNSGLINERFINYLFESLKTKYGKTYTNNEVESSFIASNGFETNLVTFERIWKNNELEVKFMKVMNKSNGFYKLKIQYSLTEEYLKNNKTKLDELNKLEIKF